jgi:DNA-directed RNA polymerase II subunit RPB1
MIILAEFEGKSNELTPKKLQSILKYISDDEIKMLLLCPDRSHPVNMLWTVLPIPPPSMRPPKLIKNNLPSKLEDHDDLTVRLKAIIKKATSLIITPDSNMRHPAYLELCKSIASYQDGKIRSDAPLEHLKDRDSIRFRFTSTTSKRGRMRLTIMGKRQNMCARSVITPDNSLGIEEVGVPQWMCMVLSFPERVTHFNIDRLKVAVDNAQFVYPGANSYSRGTDRFVLNTSRVVTLQLGDIVDRHLVNGDYVLFNRQPSLHKFSMMCHKVRVVRGSSFRMHLAVTSAYNADFDGDEMNITVLQGEEARAEASELMSPGANLMKDGYCVIKFVQHSVLGCYILTQPGVSWSGSVAREMCQEVSLESFDRLDTLYPDRESYTGYEIISSFIPRRVSFQSKQLSVIGGVLQGQTCPITKALLNNQLLRAVVIQCDRNVSISFMEECYTLFDYISTRHAPNISINDCRFALPEDTKEIIGKMKGFINQYPDHNPSHSTKNARLLESEIITATGAARDYVGRSVSQRTTQRNFLHFIIQSGAKGNSTNIVQIRGVVGQQTNHISSRLVHKTSHFPRGGVCAESHGFIESSFTTGLSSTEYFHHLMSSRVGLIDTAIKTASTGYIQRKLNKLMEDVVLDISGRAMDHKLVIQSVYGHDGLSGDLLSACQLTLHMMSDEMLRTTYDARLLDTYGECQQRLHQQMDAWHHLSQLEIKQLLTLKEELSLYIYRRGCGTQTPIGYMGFLEEIPLEVTSHAGNWSSGDTPITPYELRRGVLMVWDALVKKLHFKDTLFLRASFFTVFSTCNLWRHGVQTQRAFITIFQRVKDQIVSRTAKPYESVGILAAQNCTEPLTQLTLNRFHQSGDMSELVDGVRRMSELFNIYKAPSCPSMVLCLIPGVPYTVTHLRYLLLGTNLSQIVSDVHLSESTPRGMSETSYMCDLILDTPVCEDRGLTPEVVLEACSKLGPLSCRLCRPWVIQMEFNKEEDDDGMLPGVRIGYLKTRVFPSVHVSGIVGLSDMYIDKGRNTIITRGSNLLGVLTNLAIRSFVQINTVRTNNIMEVQSVFGVDVGSSALVDEWIGVMDTNDTNVGIKHITLIADKMSFYGQINAVSYKGICTQETSTVKRASFEKTLDSFAQGALHASMSENKGLVDSICWNKKANIGTGTVTVIPKEPTTQPCPYPSGFKKRSRFNRVPIQSPPYYPIISSTRRMPESADPSPPTQNEIFYSPCGSVFTVYIPPEFPTNTKRLKGVY